VIYIELTQKSKDGIAKLAEAGRDLMPRLSQAALHGATLLSSTIGAEEFGPGKSLNVVTGNLRRSLVGKVVRPGDPLIAAVGITKGPASKYAAIHEYGGVIKAKGGKALAIPLSAAKTPGGRPRFPGGPLEAGEKLKTFVVAEKGKPPLICTTKHVAGGGKKVRELVPLYVLVKQVRMPARHWLREGVRKHQGVFRVALREEMDRLVAEVG
jgi:hypothetical protein